MNAAVFPALRPEAYQPHALHSSERIWPETNCYVDLWIEVLNAMGLPVLGVVPILQTNMRKKRFTFFRKKRVHEFA